MKPPTARLENTIENLNRRQFFKPLAGLFSFLIFLCSKLMQIRDCILPAGVLLTTQFRIYRVFSSPAVVRFLLSYVSN